MADKTRLDMIEQCKRMDPTGQNQAVQRHQTKLAAMTDEEYWTHRAKLNEQAPAPRTARRLSNELFRWSFVRVP